MGLNTLTAREVSRDKSLAAKYIKYCFISFYANRDKVIAHV
jgi:hypothetical protein